jgi:hypothetical protein
MIAREISRQIIADLTGRDRAYSYRWISPRSGEPPPSFKAATDAVRGAEAQ